MNDPLLVALAHLFELVDAHKVTGRTYGATLELLEVLRELRDAYDDATDFRYRDEPKA